jgi:hypothetical protein
LHGMLTLIDSICETTAQAGSPREPRMVRMAPPKLRDLPITSRLERGLTTPHRSTAKLVTSETKTAVTYMKREIKDQG